MIDTLPQPPSFINIFTEQAGYSVEDILAYNSSTRYISTANGGLYRVSEDGDIIHLKGPSPDPEERID